MGLFNRIFGPRKASRSLDPDDFFYVREWACGRDTTIERVRTVLALRGGKPATFAQGIEAVDRARFLVPLDGAVFVFGPDLGFSDWHERLSRPTGQAYLIFGDTKRPNILCKRAVDGVTVRTIQVIDRVEKEGTPLPDEPSPGDDDHWSQDDVLALAASWGPDPRRLFEVRPDGVLAGA